MTATLEDDEVVATIDDDDDIDPTTVLSMALAEEATTPCLFVIVVIPPFPALRLPPVEGFSPSIHTRCCKQQIYEHFVKINYQIKSIYCIYNLNYCKSRIFVSGNKKKKETGLNF